MREISTLVPSIKLEAVVEYTSVLAKLSTA